MIITANTFTILVTQPPPDRPAAGRRRVDGAGRRKAFAEAVLLARRFAVGVHGPVPAVAGFGRAPSTGAWCSRSVSWDRRPAGVDNRIRSARRWRPPAAPSRPCRWVPSAARVVVEHHLGCLCCLFLPWGSLPGLRQPGHRVALGHWRRRFPFLGDPAGGAVLRRCCCACSRLLGFMGSTVKLATSNSVGNPVASATAVALMLAVGLVPAPGGRFHYAQFSAPEINQRYPVDVSVREWATVP